MVCVDRSGKWVWIRLMVTTLLAFIYAWPATHSYLFFYPLPKKIVTCSLQNIYFSYFCLLIIS